LIEVPSEGGDISPILSEQQSLERAEQFISKEVLNGLADKGWKQRLEGNPFFIHFFLLSLLN
jgi:hypothetical protein